MIILQLLLVLTSVTATAASATLLGAAVYTAWAAKYHSSGTASSAIATMTSPTIGAELPLKHLLGL